VALARDYLARLPAGADAGVPAAALSADGDYFREVVLLSQPKIRAIEELPAYTAYFFTEDFAIDAKARDKVMARGDPKTRLRELDAALKTADFSSDGTLEQVVLGLAAKNGLGIGDYIHPGRLAMSGVSVGPSFYGLLRVLGRDRVLRRIERFLRMS
jgi:glutamyl-tRNA synthetase